ncbi:MAG: hypothetical protein EOP51_29595, partial [Sphingobacteriales bacterium]
GILLSSCKKKKEDIEPPVPSSDKLIVSFSFKQANNTAYLNEDASGAGAADTLIITVPAETDISNLKPDITIVGKSISPASGEVKNFLSPVTYIVTAEDGSTRKYVVVVNYRSTVFFSSLDGALYALDASNGQLIWRLSNGQFHSGTPSVYKGFVYINAMDGVYAVDARKGTQKWKYAIPTSASWGGTEFFPSPVVVNDVVYIAAFDGYVYALNSADGTLKWKTKSSSGAPFISSVTLHNNMLYAGCGDSYLYALNTASGNIAWKFNALNPIYSNPLIVGNNVCIEAYAKNCYLLNGTTGSVIWTTPGISNMSNATLADGKIFSGGGNSASAYDSNTGVQVWSILFTPGGLIHSERSGPVIDDGKFYAGSNNGSLYAYDIATKNRLWTFNSITINGGYIYGSPVLADGRLYFGNNNGNMYAVSVSTGLLLWSTGTSNGIYGSACVVDKKGVKHYPAISGEQQ